MLSQVYILDDGIDGNGIVTCSGTFYDSGGPNGDYLNDEDYVVTFCSSSPGEPLSIDFTIDTEENFDQIFIFDGPTTSSTPFPGSPFDGTQIFTVTSTGPCLTINFSTGSIVTSDGFEGVIYCGEPEPCSATLVLDSTIPSACSLCNGNASLNFNGPGLPITQTLIQNGTILVDGLSATGQIDFGALCPGDYTVEVEAADGCLYEQDFNIPSVNSPAVTVVSASDFCLGEQSEIVLELTGTGPWLLGFLLNGIPQGNISIPSSPFTFFLDQSAIITLTNLEDSNCSIPIDIEFDVNQIPGPTASCFGDLAFCLGGSADIVIDLVGTSPWIISYTLDGLPQPDIITSDNPYILVADVPGLYELTGVVDGFCTGIGDGTVLVEEVTAPVATLSGGGDYCLNDGTLPPLDLDIIGQGPFTLTYSIDGVVQAPIQVPNNFSSLDVPGPGLYELISVSSGSCIGTVSGQALVNALPEPTIALTNGPDFEFCLGENVDLEFEFTGTGPWTVQYFIDFGNIVTFTADVSPFSLNVDEPGLYQIFTVDDQVCSSFIGPLFQVTQSPTPTATLIEDVQICPGGSANVPVLLSDNETYDLTYALNGTVQESITVTGPEAQLLIDEAGFVSLVSLSQGTCQGVVFGFIDVTEAALPEASLNGDIAFCEGDVGTVQLDLIGQGPWTLEYSINNGTALQETALASPALIQVNEPGTFQLIGIADANCSAPIADEISLTQNSLPLATLSGDAVICQGTDTDIQIDFVGTPPFSASITLDGLPFSTFNAVSGDTTITVSEAGLYSIALVTDADCQNSGAGTALIGFIEAPQLDLPLDTSLCIGESITVTVSAEGGAGGPYGFTWVDGGDLIQGASITLTPSQTQSLELIYTDACAFPYSQFIAINVFQNPVVELGNGSSVLCGQTEVLLDTEPTLSQVGEDCTWIIGLDTIQGCQALTYVFTDTGIYDVSLSVTTQQGCGSETEYPGLITINGAPLADFTYSPFEPTSIENIVTFIDLSQNAVAYEWYLDSILFSQNASPSLFFPEQETTEFWNVCQVVTTEEGCTDTLCQSIKVQGELAVFVPDAFTPDNDRVNDYFYPRITGASEEEYLFQIYDRMGSLVWETAELNGKWSGEGANGSDYFTRDGVYTWRMEVKLKNSVDKRLFQGMVTIVR